MGVEEAKAELELLRQEVAVLNVRLVALKDEQQQIEERLYEIHGGFRGYGEMSRARQKVKVEERAARDATLRLVVWKVEPSTHWNDKSPEPYVVDKVTPKRIYVRRRGEERADYYVKDGTTGKSYGASVIDVDKTFPEGLDEYAKANK
jgi:hypothetical protein